MTQEISRAVGPREDAFGNAIDPTVGYARGAIMASSNDETLKNLRADELIRLRVAEHGLDSVFVFTGMACDFPLGADDLPTFAQEAIGPALFGSALRERAIGHMGGQSTDEVAILNRTSGGIVATCLALCAEGDTLISFIPGALSHPSVKRGAQLAGASLLETTELGALQSALAETTGSLVIVTGVTSEQVIIPESDLTEALRMTREAGRISLVDDAYGARVRTVLFGQGSARAAGADLVITSNQKAGLTGPRAGILIGEGSLVKKVLSTATKYGQEARGPIALGVLRALEQYDPAHLLASVEVGRELYAGMKERFGSERVSWTALGPIIEQDDILSIVLERAGLPASSATVVPAEASAGLGMYLLERHGILTVNVAGNPGSKPSLRLKASSAEMGRAGGPATVVAAVDDAFDRLARVIGDPGAIRRLVLTGPTD